MKPNAAIDNMPSGNYDYKNHMWLQGRDAGRQHAREGRDAPTENPNAGYFYLGFCAGFAEVSVERVKAIA